MINISKSEYVIGDDKDTYNEDNHQGKIVLNRCTISCNHGNIVYRIPFCGSSFGGNHTRRPTVLFNIAVFQTKVKVYTELPIIEESTTCE